MYEYNSCLWHETDHYISVCQWYDLHMLRRGWVVLPIWQNKMFLSICNSNKGTIIMQTYSNTITCKFHKFHNANVCLYTVYGFGQWLTFLCWNEHSFLDLTWILYINAKWMAMRKTGLSLALMGIPEGIFDYLKLILGRSTNFMPTKGLWNVTMFI